MAPASPPASSPALPWAAAAAVAPTQPPVAEEEATPADFLTEAEQAAAVATSVQAGAQLEVLWEVDGEEQGWTVRLLTSEAGMQGVPLGTECGVSQWWPASVEEPSSSAAHPPHTWRIRYAAAEACGKLATAQTDRHAHGRYEAQHGHAAEDALVTFGAPGESWLRLDMHHAPVGDQACEPLQVT